jgi:hypothetical protein
MAISSWLVNFMGGEIQIECSPHVGATFSFYIDLPVVSEKDMNTQKVQMRTLQWQGSPRILLVEDNAINLDVAEIYPHKLGCI